MSQVLNYGEWKDNAEQMDDNSGATAWKNKETSRRYDYRVIRKRYDELVEIRKTKDPVRLLYYLNEGIHGNMGGMGSPELYSEARFGTKTLIENYITELVAALHQLNEASSKRISQLEKVVYFKQAMKCFGRTALMFGGAGSLGAFHVGVIKALVEQDLLPKVISGASTGAFVSALVATRSQKALEKLLLDGDLAEALQFDVSTSHRRTVDHYDFERMIERHIPDLTFTEAYQISGIHLNIAVAPSELQQRSRLLNATTSPNAFIREAVLASCAVPGMFPAVSLKAKDFDGKRQPYIPSRTWIDGSIIGALPTKRLARLYGVNHFISSQDNPIAVLANRHLQTNVMFDKWLGIQQSASREWMRAFFPVAMEGIKDIYPLNVLARNWFSNVTQDFSADINILPVSGVSRPGQLFKTLTREETQTLIDEGEQRTWPVTERIRLNTAVSRCIEEILASHGETLLI